MLRKYDLFARKKKKSKKTFKGPWPWRALVPPWRAGSQEHRSPWPRGLGRPMAQYINRYILPNIVGRNPAGAFVQYEYATFPALRRSATTTKKNCHPCLAIALLFFKKHLIAASSQFTASMRARQVCRALRGSSTTGRWGIAV